MKRLNLKTGAGSDVMQISSILTVSEKNGSLMSPFWFTIIVGTLVLGISGIEAAPDNLQAILKRIDRHRKRLVSHAPQLNIERFTSHSKQHVRCGERWEGVAHIAAEYRNPYDPDEIDVSARIVLPNGKAITIPAFYLEPCEPLDGLTRMTAGVPYRRTGNGHWRVRFAPFLPGRHQVTLVAKDRHGKTVQSKPVTFMAEANDDNPGYIRIARANPQYFEDTAQEKLFWPAGVNIAWTRRHELRKHRPAQPPCYEYYFRRASGQMNATRVWLCHWAWLEWVPYQDAPQTSWTGYAGLGYYNPMIADTLDRVFELAEKHHIRIMLVTEDNNELMKTDHPDSWAAHPYNRIYGGPCSEPKDYFSSAQARRWYKKRLRYIIARWGYSTSLWAINSWNDMRTPNPAVLTWLREMRSFCHRLVSGWRPIIYGSNYTLAASTITDYSQGRVMAGKPAIIQECQHAHDDHWFAGSVRRQLWRGLSSGLAGVMVWPHVQVDRCDAWSIFRPVVNLTAELPLNRTPTRPIDRAQIRIDVPSTDRTFWSISDFSPYGDVSFWHDTKAKNTFEIDPQQGSWLQQWCPTLFAPKRQSWHHPLTFRLSQTRKGDLFLLRIKEIGPGTQTLDVRVADQPVRQFVFKKGRRYLDESEQWIRLPLPTGRDVTIQITLSHGDWLRLASVHHASHRSAAHDLVIPTGLRYGAGGILYLENASYDRRTLELFSERPVTLANLRLSFKVDTPRPCFVRQFDPISGKVLSKQTIVPKQRMLYLTIPHLEQALVIQWEQRDITGR